MNELNLKTITELLINHYGIKSGKFELVVEFGIGVGKVGPNEEPPMPGVMVGVSKIGLVEVTEDGPNVVDAKLLQPKKKPVARKSTAKK